MKHFTLAAFLGLLFSCNQPDHEDLIQQLIDRRIKDRITRFIELEKKKCSSDLLLEASTLADSLLRANPPILIQIDSLQRPPKPLKPPDPNFSRPTDTIKIEPILPKHK